MLKGLCIISVLLLLSGCSTTIVRQPSDVYYSTTVAKPKHMKSLITPGFY